MIHGAELQQLKLKRVFKRKKKTVPPGFSALIQNCSFRDTRNQISNLETPWFVSTYAGIEVLGKPRINPSAVFCREII